MSKNSEDRVSTLPNEIYLSIKSASGSRVSQDIFARLSACSQDCRSKFTWILYEDISLMSPAQAREAFTTLRKSTNLASMVKRLEIRDPCSYVDQDSDHGHDGLPELANLTKLHMIPSFKNSCQSPHEPQLAEIGRMIEFGRAWRITQKSSTELDPLVITIENLSASLVITDQRSRGTSKRYNATLRVNLEGLPLINGNGDHDYSAQAQSLLQLIMLTQLHTESGNLGFGVSVSNHNSENREVIAREIDKLGWPSSSVIQKVLRYD